MNNKKSGGYPLFGEIRLVRLLVYHFHAVRATAMARWLALGKHCLGLGRRKEQGSPARHRGRARQEYLPVQAGLS